MPASANAIGVPLASDVYVPVTVPSGMLTPTATGVAAGAGIVNPVVRAAWTAAPVAPAKGTIVALSSVIGTAGEEPSAVYTPLRNPAEATTVTSKLTVNDVFGGTGVIDGVATMMYSSGNLAPLKVLLHAPNT